MNALVSMINAPTRALFRLGASSQLYEGVAIATAVVGYNSEEHVFVDAIEGDMVATVDVVDFFAAFPVRPAPRRLDKMTVGGRTYTVQGWHAAPPDGSPVWFRMLLRGGTM